MGRVPGDRRPRGQARQCLRPATGCSSSAPGRSGSAPACSRACRCPGDCARPGCRNEARRRARSPGCEVPDRWMAIPQSLVEAFHRRRRLRRGVRRNRQSKAMEGGFELRRPWRPLRSGQRGQGFDHVRRPRLPSQGDDASRQPQCDRPRISKRVIAAMREGRVPVDRLITHRTSLRDAVKQHLRLGDPEERPHQGADRNRLMVHRRSPPGF